MNYTKIVQEAFTKSSDSIEGDINQNWSTSFDELGIDSLVLIEVATTLSDRLGQDIQDKDLIVAGTMENCVKVLEEKYGSPTEQQ